MNNLKFACLKPKITKDFILSKVNQESIMQCISTNNIIGTDTLKM